MTSRTQRFEAQVMPHLDAVVTKFCLATETSTSIVLNTPREHATVLPARRENIKPSVKKVTGR